MNKYLAKLSAMKNGDKLGHFLKGLAAIGAYVLLFYVSLALIPLFPSLGMQMMFNPYLVAAVWMAIIVHGAKEVEDLVAKMRGEPHDPSLLDFLAGMAGSVVGIVLVLILM